MVHFCSWSVFSGVGRYFVRSLAICAVTSNISIWSSAFQVSRPGKNYARVAQLDAATDYSNPIINIENRFGERRYPKARAPIKLANSTHSLL